MGDIEPTQIQSFHIHVYTILILELNYELTELFIKALKHPIAAV